MKNKILSSLLVATLLGGSFSLLSANGGVEDTQIGLRKTPLNDEKDVKLQDFKFGSGSAGESQKIERSYENAPPLIPHDTEGMLPITQQDNACIGCHATEVAQDIGATPMPKSHYYDLRNKKALTDGISDSRYNCVQCHVPQAQTKPLVGNSFKPDFRNENEKHQSNLLDVINQGVK